MGPEWIAQKFWKVTYFFVPAYLYISMHISHVTSFCCGACSSWGCRWMLDVTKRIVMMKTCPCNVPTLELPSHFGQNLLGDQTQVLECGCEPGLNSKRRRRSRLHMVATVTTSGTNVTTKPGDISIISCLFVRFLLVFSFDKCWYCYACWPSEGCNVTPWPASNFWHLSTEFSTGGPKVCSNMKAGHNDT